MITLKNNNTSEVIELPADFLWQNEFNYSSVQQNAQYSLAGSLIIQEGLKRAGRPISLTGETWGWVTRDLVTTLQSWADTADLTMELTIESRVFTVMFSRSSEAVIANAVVHRRPDEDSDQYTITINLMQVE